jgi:hypothetical protein
MHEDRRELTDLSTQELQDWIDALRSGDYLQGRGFLKYDLLGEVRFCCLGVLWDVMKEKHSKAISVYGGNGPLAHPTVVRLINLNDYEFRDFSYIADWVEANLKGV